MSSLAGIIAKIESGDNPRRIRFESQIYTEGLKSPAWLALVRRIAALNGCSDDTARMIACTSWGVHQILGENLYDVCRVTTDIFTFVASPEAQLAAFLRFIERRGIDFTIEELLADPLKQRAFVAVYNGPGNIDGYWSRMKQQIEAFSPPENAPSPTA